MNDIFCQKLFHFHCPAGHFLLTELLLETLKQSEPSRIINTTASAQNLGDINFDDVNRESNYVAGEAYAQSKLAVVLHTLQLAQRLKGLINLTTCTISLHLPCPNFSMDI